MANMMTDEEADALDELYTQTIPPIRTGLGGPLTRQRDLLRSLDKEAPLFKSPVYQSYGPESENS